MNSRKWKKKLERRKIRLKREIERVLQITASLCGQGKMRSFNLIN